MNRTALALLASLLPIAAHAAAAINLDRPGALESIQAGNPEHHSRIVGILKASQEMPCQAESLHRLVTHYDARDARCSKLMMTSFPAKRRLTFSLDGQRYIATVEMNDDSRLVKVPSR